MTDAATDTRAAAPRTNTDTLLVRWAPVGFVAGFLLLNAGLTFDNHWPGMGVAFAPRLSLEACLFVGLLALWVGRYGALTARAAFWWAAGCVLLVVLRYVNVTAPAVMGRPLHLYWDGRHAYELAKVLAGSWPWWQLAGLLLALVLGLLVLGVMARAALAALTPALRQARSRRWVWTAVGLALLGYAAHLPPVWDVRPHFASPVLPTVLRQGVLLSQALLPSRNEDVLSPSPAFDTDLSALQTDEGPLDVVLLFAESYGAITLDDDAHRAILAPARERLQEALLRNGREVVSGRVRAATFGGASWLSHASLLSGVDTSDPAHYNLLLTSQRPSLVSHFAAHGYRTVGWMPGIKRPWPEGSFYGFDRVADDAGIGYQGPDFGYWRIPDQASMAALHQQELSRTAGARPPVFAVFPTITSHAPFHPLPPLLPDTHQALAPNAYTGDQLATALAAPPTPGQAVVPYLRSISDQFDWLASYLDHPATAQLLLIVVGDHQPPGMLNGQDASWDVPVHVIGAPTALLQRLRAMGFVSGLLPEEGALGSMHGLTQMLLEAFDTRSEVLK